MKLSGCIQLEFLSKTAIMLLLSFIFCAPAKTQSYTEPYRPQFHVSPALGFMGDPNNMKWVMTCGIGPNQRGGF